MRVPVAVTVIRDVTEQRRGGWLVAVAGRQRSFAAEVLLHDVIGSRVPGVVPVGGANPSSSFLAARQGSVNRNLLVGGVWNLRQVAALPRRDTEEGTSRGASSLKFVFHCKVFKPKSIHLSIHF